MGVASLADHIDQCLETVLANTGQEVMVGPVMWHADPDQKKRGYDVDWYFFVASGATPESFCLHSHGFRWRRDLAEEGRDDLISKLRARQPPLRVFIFDDELELARCARTIWPCAKSERIAAGMAADRVLM